MQNEYLVIKWDWIEETLTDEELDTFYSLISVVTEDKPECDYLVVNSQEPYAEEVDSMIKRGKGSTKGKGVVTKSYLLKELKELTEADPELAHGEADELLINYINDAEIEKAFDEVPKWYS